MTQPLPSRRPACHDSEAAARSRTPETGTHAAASTASSHRRHRTMPNIIRTSAGIPLRVTSTGHLALPPRKPPCMGYQNACVCPACLDRIQRPITAQPPAPQPWEPKHQEEAA